MNWLERERTSTTRSRRIERLRKARLGLPDNASPTARDYWLAGGGGIGWAEHRREVERARRSARVSALASAFLDCLAVVVLGWALLVVIGGGP